MIHLACDLGPTFGICIYDYLWNMDYFLLWLAEAIPLQPERRPIAAIPVRLLSEFRFELSLSRYRGWSYFNVASPWHLELSPLAPQGASAVFHFLSLPYFEPPGAILAPQGTWYRSKHTSSSSPQSLWDVAEAWSSQSCVLGLPARGLSQGSRI
jgi:hypothetical protein